MKSNSLAIFSFALCLVLLSNVATARDSGIESILTQKAADYFNSKLIPILRDELGGSTIPGFSISGGTVSNIRIGSLGIGSSSIRMNPSGVTFSLSSISIPGSADWKYKVWFFRFSGSVSIHVSGSISVTLSANELNQRPDFDTGHCSLSTNVSLRFHGSIIAWILNLFSRSLGGKVENFLEGNTCRIIKDILNREESQVVRSYPILIPIGNVLKLDLGLSADPKFCQDFLQIPLGGLTSDLLSSDDLDLLAQLYPSDPLTSGIQTNRMLFFRLKPHTINAALLAYHRANSFTTVWDISEFSDTIFSVIDTGAIKRTNVGQCSTPEMCSIQIRVYAPDAPTIALETDEIIATGTAIVEINLLNLETQETVTVLKLTIRGKLCGNLTAEQRESDLFAKVQVTCASVLSTRVDQSLINGFSNSQMASMINELINQMLPVANTYLDQGVLIQQPGSFTIKDLILNVMSGYLEVGANLIYNNWG